jgi:DNA-directed RNA polymerase specialized sigma24 family protein
MPYGIYVSKETVQEIAKLTTEGLRAKEIAIRLGLHVDTVWHHRPAGSRQTKTTPEGIQKWFDHYSQGWSIAETAREFGVAGETVRKAFKRAGFPMRKAA